MCKILEFRKFIVFEIMNGLTLTIFLVLKILFFYSKKKKKNEIKSLYILNKRYELKSYRRKLVRNLSITTH